MTADRSEMFDQPPAYEEGDKVVYRASSLGMCNGALVRARLGVTGSPPPDLMQERFDEGTDWEERVLLAGLGVDWSEVTLTDHLALYGRVTEAAGGRRQVQAEVAWGNKVVRCHPDAIAYHGQGAQGQRVVEVKFLGPEMMQEKMRGIAKDGMRGLGSMYAWQASIEMLSTGLPMLYIIGEKKVGVPVGGKRVVDLAHVEVYEWDEPCYSLADVKMRVLEIEGYVARGEMPDCPVPFMYPCPYWQEHPAREREELDDAGLVYAVETWKKARDLELLAGKDTDAAKADVEREMDRLGLHEAKCAGVNIAVVPPAEQGNVAWAKWASAVKKKYPEVKELSEDEFRGKAREGYVRITLVDDKEKD